MGNRSLDWLGQRSINVWNAAVRRWWNGVVHKGLEEV